MKESLSDLVMLYAITPSHIGSGGSLGLIDNPIQRERHTNWPVIPASGFKGAIRHRFDEEDEQLADYVFGKTSDGDSSAYAGAMNVTDIQILAYPMRSSFAPFVYITCPAVLRRLQHSLEAVGKEIFPKIDFSKMDIGGLEAVCLSPLPKQKEFLVEDYVLKTSDNDEAVDEFNKMKELFSRVIPAFGNPQNGPKVFAVSDDVFNYSVSQCTEVNARIRIDAKTGATAKGSLRYQEELPSDCVMYALTFWGDSFGDADYKAETVKEAVVSRIPEFIQIGGDMTMGRGLFRIYWGLDDGR